MLLGGKKTVFSNQIYKTKRQTEKFFNKGTSEWDCPINHQVPPSPPLYLWYPPSSFCGHSSVRSRIASLLHAGLLQPLSLPHMCFSQLSTLQLEGFLFFNNAKLIMMLWSTAIPGLGLEEGKNKWSKWSAFPCHLLCSGPHSAPAGLSFSSHLQHTPQAPYTYTGPSATLSFPCSSPPSDSSGLKYHFPRRAPRSP